MKILLVDDDQSILDVFSQVLQRGGYTVVTSASGGDALEKIRNEKPDVIILDQMLPDMNGNDVLETVKNDPATKHIPVAMLSNFNKPDLMDKAMQLGASDYILKYQIDPDDLKVKIQEMTNQANGAQQNLVT